MCFSVKETTCKLTISHKYRFIGCSTDGVVSCYCTPACLKKLVEVKCPWSVKDIKKNVGLVKGCRVADNKLILSPESEYYCQIQGQLGIDEYDYCDLIICTKKGFQVVEEDLISKMVQQLKIYLTNEVLPGLVHL